MNISINRIAKEIHKNNIRKAFWKTKNENEKLWLIITEMAELTDADREGKTGDINLFEKEFKDWGKKKCTKKVILNQQICSFKELVKNCVGDELADAFIRLCDYCVGFRYPIKPREIQSKLNENYVCMVQLKNLSTELLGLTGLLFQVINGNQKAISWSFAKLIWLSEELDIPLEKHIKWKMWYNSTRPKMHNKKY